MKHVEVSYFRHYSSSPETVTLLPLFSEIVENPVLYKRIEMCRFYKPKDAQKYSELKKELPSFTTSATFKDKRNSSNVLLYNGLVCVDFDHVSKHLLEELKNRLSEIPCVYAAFVSPSGEGLKVIIKTNNTCYLKHSEVVVQCWDYLKRHHISLEPDKSGKDVARLCFMSHDPKLYLHEQAQALEIKTDFTQQRLSKPVSLSHVFGNELEKVEAFTNNKNNFQSGNRNNYVFIFACNARKMNVLESETHQYAQKFIECDFSPQEIEKIIKSAYRYG